MESVSQGLHKLSRTLVPSTIVVLALGGIRLEATNLNVHFVCESTKENRNR